MPDASRSSWSGNYPGRPLRRSPEPGRGLGDGTVERDAAGTDRRSHPFQGNGFPELHPGVLRPGLGTVNAVHRQMDAIADSGEPGPQSRWTPIAVSAMLLEAAASPRQTVTA